MCFLNIRENIKAVYFSKIKLQTVHNEIAPIFVMLYREICKMVRLFSYWGGKQAQFP